MLHIDSQNCGLKVGTIPLDWIVLGHMLLNRVWMLNGMNCVTLVMSGLLTQQLFCPFSVLPRSTLWLSCPTAINQSCRV